MRFYTEVHSTITCLVASLSGLVVGSVFQGMLSTASGVFFGIVTFILVIVLGMVHYSYTTERG